MADTVYRPFIDGPRLSLREVRPEDVTPQYLAWMNDPEVNHYLESRYYPMTIDQLRQYVVDRQGDRDNVFLAMIVKETGRHIGNIKLGGINWIHRYADVALMVGDKDAWGKGYGSEAIGLVTRYAFDTLNLHKLTASCYEANMGSAKAFLKTGWVQEGIKRRQWFADGRYQDGILLAVWRDDAQ